MTDEAIAHVLHRLIDVSSIQTEAEAAGLHALVNGNGELVTDDDDNVTGVAVTDAEADVDELAGLTKAELQDLADERGVDVPASATKGEIRAALQAEG